MDNPTFRNIRHIDWFWLQAHARIMDKEAKSIDVKAILNPKDWLIVAEFTNDRC